MPGLAPFQHMCPQASCLTSLGLSVPPVDGDAISLMETH